MSRLLTFACFSSIAALATLAGCASTRTDAEFADPRFVGQSLTGKKVLIVCDAADVTLKRVCQDRMSAEVSANGATPVIAPDNATPGTAPAATTDRGLAAARSAGASAALSTTITADASVANPGPSIGFGLGGFSGGSRGGTGVDGGLSFPIGGSKIATGYAASGVLTDVATGQLMWTGRAVAPASDDAGAQLRDLARALVGSAKKSKVF